MNERIKELELEAIAYADSKVPAMDRYNDIYHSIVRGKFADLLLEEVMQTLFITGHESAFDELNKHFGVEE